MLSLSERLEALESKVNKTSQNSGKPPGGQAGHKGKTLKRVAEPTDTVNHPLPQQCMRCHSALPLEQAEVAARRQIINVPATVFDVIEHRPLAVTRRCGQAHVSKFADEVTELVQYGPNMRALGVHLTQGQMLPYVRAAELIHDVYGLTISPATLLAWVAEARAALQATADTLPSGCMPRRS